ncbi:elongator complex protein 5 [Chanos chanos]|uniref:Elongator complex protein 5 n=1 Tax=Chanos chanos TaxID=29144 RepID=A0A6J2VWZ1_CHACN|nr:elongator complex protein 5 [Chanos chanos]
MLLDVLQGSEAGGFIVIQDTIHCSGRELLKCFVNTALKREDAVHILGFETSEEELRNGLDNNCALKLHFHNGYTDPLGWTNCSLFTVKQFTTEHIGQLLKKSTNPKATTLVIDSLSWILRHHNPVTVCQRLHELKKGGSVKVIIALLHSDLHQRGIVGSICHLATTVISVTPGKRERSAMAKTTRRSKSGKVMQDEEFFNVTKDYAVTVQSRSSYPEPRQTEAETTEADPTANLTFNLRLSEMEREAKEKVALPFVFSQEKKSALLKPVKGSGRILYEPDANDDFDQEDPDDDLDI